jgi:sulfate adenylyltransferase subunit 1 (EFTu-like GTPase family)
MPDFWDKLFKVNLSPNDPTYAIDGVAAVIGLYARGDVTKGQAADLLIDSEGNLPSQDDKDQAVILLDTIDLATGAGVTLQFNKAQIAQRVIDVLHVVELGYTDKQTAKNFLGV